MLKYRGEYRVVFEMDAVTGKPVEFAFIPCKIKKCANICRHDKNNLNAYIPGARISKRLLQEYPNIFSYFQSGEKGVTLLFPEPMMDKAVKILKPYVLGKSISPQSAKNLKFIGDNVTRGKKKYSKETMEKWKKQAKKLNALKSSMLKLKERSFIWRKNGVYEDLSDFKGWGKVIYHLCVFI